MAKTHGMRRTKVWGVWWQMHQRCRNPNVKAYPRYGGRGIAVCERWQDFENFFADMGEPPPGHSLDRIDNNGNYDPSNCRWATPKQQQQNRRNARLLTVDGVTKLEIDWSREIGFKTNVMKARRRGPCPWAEEHLLITREDMWPHRDE